MQIPTILPRIVLDMAGGVCDPAPGIVYTVGARWVPPSHVLVDPRESRQGGDAEGAHGEESGDGDEDDGAGGNPDGTGEEDKWGEEDKGEDGGGKGEAGEDKEDSTGDDKGQKADELGGVGGVAVDPPEECCAGGALASTPGGGRPGYRTWAGLAFRH